MNRKTAVLLLVSLAVLNFLQGVRRQIEVFNPALCRWRLCLLVNDAPKTGEAPRIYRERQRLALGFARLAST